MLHDPWLDRWIPMLRDGAGTKPVLELGCGTGADTATLVEAGLAVVAVDICAASVRATRLRAPAATVLRQDVRDPFPIADGEAGAALASLSLHYFAWSETVTLMRRIRQVLPIGGLLLCRLNSTEDENFGASGHPALETNYYLVNGQAKRFFDDAGVTELFGPGWTVLSKEHQFTRKYVQSKALWEVIARRDT